MDFSFPEKGMIMKFWRRRAVRSAVVRYLQAQSADWVLKDQQSISLGAEQGLCIVCRHINFEWLLNNNAEDAMASYETQPQGSAFESRDASYVSIPGRGVSERLMPLSLGPLMDIIAEENCPFCVLVTHAICISLDTNRQSLPSLLLQGYGEYPRVVDLPADEAQCYLTSLDKGGGNPPLGALTLRVWITEGSSKDVRAVDIHRISNSQEPWQGRCVGDRVDFGVLKNWVMRPNDALSPLSGKALLSQFRLIDVQKQCVVQARSGLPFLALSYVWGGAAVLMNTKAIAAELALPGALARQVLPQTIRDAMKIVSRIGQRYLWVDSLCIIQDDESSKWTQINAMDRIYACSIATIAAVAGTSANAGIPGINPHSRKQWQLIKSVRGIDLANRWNLGGDREEILEKIPWASRAWTFQEQILSTRLLYFLPHSVWMEDARHIYEEDIHESEDIQATVSVAGIISRRHTQYGGNFIANIQQYRMAVSEYMRRNMTYESDALIAFAGILNILQPAFESDFVFGLPSLEMEFAMLWTPESTLRRRKDPKTGQELYPSWSWAGWVGRIDYKIGDIEKRFARVTWLDSQSGLPFTSFEARGGSTIRREWNSVKTRHGRDLFYRESRKDLVFSNPVAEADSRPRFTLVKLGSYTLTFQALSAVVPLSPGRWCMETLKPMSHRHLSPEICSYTLQDVSGSHRCGGVVYLHDGVIPGQPFTRSCEIVAISRTTHERVSSNECKDPPEDDSDLIAWQPGYRPRRQLLEERGALVPGYSFKIPWSMYDVLVIEWVGPVAKRIGVGVAYAEAFWYAKPVRKTIVLQ